MEEADRTTLAHRHRPPKNQRNHPNRNRQPNPQAIADLTNREEAEEEAEEEGEENNVEEGQKT